MEISNQILRDVNEEGQIYLIDLETGLKAEVFIKSKERILLLRDEIEKEDIKRASSKLDLTELKQRQHDDQSDINSLKKIAKEIKGGFISKYYPDIKMIEFHVGDYTYESMYSLK